MPGIIDCPSCGRKLRVPEAVHAGSVKCPACGGLFQASDIGLVVSPASSEADAPLVATADDGLPLPLIPGVPPPPAPLRPVLISSVEEPRPPGRPPAEFCIGCGKRLPSGAYYCPFCGERFESFADDARPWECPGAPPRRDYEAHRGPLIYNLGLVSLLLGIPGLCGILCLPMGLSGLISAALGGVTWAMAAHDLRRMTAALMDPQGQERTRTGKYYAIAGTILGSLSIVFGAMVHLVQWGLMFP
jgi:hypothetical protein